MRDQVGEAEMNLVEIDTATVEGNRQWANAHPTARWMRFDDPEPGCTRKFIDIDAQARAEAEQLRLQASAETTERLLGKVEYEDQDAD